MNWRKRESGKYVLSADGAHIQLPCPFSIVTLERYSCIRCIGLSWLCLKSALPVPHFVRTVSFSPSLNVTGQALFPWLCSAIFLYIPSLLISASKMETAGNWCLICEDHNLNFNYSQILCGNNRRTDCLIQYKGILSLKPKVLMAPFSLVLWWR